MNCRDVAEILDGGDVAGAGRAGDEALQRHFEDCADCAGQWRASEAMAALRADVPELPESLREVAARLEARNRQEAGPATIRRPVLVGSLLLVGLATALFGAGGWQDAGAVEPQS